MAPELYKVSVPGSLMVMGEHAVLHGKQAIVCAVDKRLNMQLIPSSDRTVTISDTRLGILIQELDTITMQAPFKFVLQAVLAFKDQIPSGFTLEVHSEFSSIIGFGSSAAVTVATVAVLAQWLQISLTLDDVFARSKQVMLEVQGVGSGADVAASVYGGVVAYSLSSVRPILKLSAIPPLTALYCGYKTPTPEVIRIVQQVQAENPSKYAQIYESIHDCATRAIDAIKDANWQLLGELFSQQYQLQAELGVSDAKLDQLINILNAEEQIYGAKISGAGLGDCVIGLGKVPQQLISGSDNMLQFQINIDQQGLTYANQ